MSGAGQPDPGSPSGSASGEDRLIARHFAPLAKHPGALGLADDAALLTPPKGHELVLKADAIVERMHYLPDDPPATVARKALRINLSDLAAKGAAPLGFLLSLALPKGFSDDWLAAFSQALGEDAEAYRCPLLGGDTVGSPGPVMVSIAAFGSVPAGTMAKRSGAKPGDRIVVTGTIGDAALGLLVRQDCSIAERWGIDAAMHAHLVDRYRVPQPRTAAADAVRTHATGSMDVSDGLVGDLAKLCAASGVGATLDAVSVPLSPAAARAVAAEPERLVTVLTGGDDFEILTTVAPQKLAAYLAAAAAAGVTATEIGEILPDPAPLAVIGPDGGRMRFPRESFSHF